MRFYAPRRLRVHAGTTIVFTLAGFHTATLLPANRDVGRWTRRNAGGIGKPYSLISRDRDDGRRATKFNNAAIFGPQGCGTPGNPCAYDGSSVVNSGAFVQSPRFAVTINANVGDTIWVICLIHPRMRLRIRVVAAGADAATQQQINTYRDNISERDRRRAGRVHRRMLDTRAKHLENGKVVWDAYAGVDRRGFALDAMYPKRVRIRRGQRVRWHFDRLRYEDHTVTFPLRRGLRVAGSAGAPACDPGQGPDNPPDQETPPFCNDPSQLELDIPGRFGFKVGDRVHKRRDFDSSGVRGANIGGQRSYKLRFTKRSRKAFKYLCMIHPFMRGSVVVRGR
jgi:plastocyanin